MKKIDEYVASQPVVVRATLKRLRATIREAIPEAEEVISYQMPAFKYHGIVVWFAAFTNHNSLFARPQFLDAFESEIVQYRKTKSALHFPIGKPIPFRLVARIAKYIAKQNASAAKK